MALAAVLDAAQLCSAGYGRFDGLIVEESHIAGLATLCGLPPAAGLHSSASWAMACSEVCELVGLTNFTGSPFARSQVWRPQSRSCRACRSSWASLSASFSGGGGFSIQASVLRL